MAKVLKKIILTLNAPKPSGPYSQAVQVGNTVYVSGVLAMDKDSMQLVDGGAGPQARKALANLSAILAQADSSFDKIVKATIFLDDINDYNAVNDVYKENIKPPFPARSTFQVGKLPLESINLHNTSSSDFLTPTPQSLASVVNGSAVCKSAHKKSITHKGAKVEIEAIAISGPVEHK